MSGRLDFTCGTCGAKPGERCKTRTTGRTTDTHQSRHDQAYDAWIARVSQRWTAS